MSTASEIVETSDLEKLMTASRSYAIQKERLDQEEKDIVIARQNLTKRESAFAIQEDALLKLEANIRQLAKKL